MTMTKIPSNVPVFIQSFEEQEKDGKRYTKAKLKVFYIGETPDHRLFTKEFSDKVIKTLPLTPVVGFYAEEDEDFIGHNNIQYIYGVVPDSAEMYYEEDEQSGNTFFITDVILYTERKDNIGTIAKKIIGKQHSLELDPDTLKYKINKDNQGRFLNIEFIDGNFIGLSVLGDKENPAFKGSGFFTINKDFEQIITECKTNFDKFISLLNNNGGNIEVFNSENFFKLMCEKFSKISMQEFQSKIYTALDSIGQYGWLVENTEEYAIISTWSEEENRSMYLKYSITIDGDNLTLGSAEEVKVKYLTQEELVALDSAQSTTNSFASDEEDDKEKQDGQCNAANSDSDDKDDKDDQNSEDDKDTDNTDDKKDEQDDEDDKKDDEDAFSTDTGTEGEIADASQSNKQQEEEEDDEQVGMSTASASASSLSDGEKTELENYRKQTKQSIINEYEQDLNHEILEFYLTNIDKYSAKELEAELAIEYRKAKKSDLKEQNKIITAFKTITTAADYDETNPADVINKYARK